MSLSLIIPTYRNPTCLDLCLRSALENQVNKNEIIVIVDGFYNESKEILDKYKDINIIDFPENRGMQMALNIGVMNATNETICIINDDNILSKGWDEIIEMEFRTESVLTINQIEPRPSMFGFHTKDFGLKPEEFKYDEFMEYEPTIREKKFTLDGGIFPFVISKKNYMIVGGFDTLYQSPFVVDWDFFLKLDLNGVGFYRTNNLYFYHFGSYSTKKSKEGDNFISKEVIAAEMFIYKWGIQPNLYEHNSHRPKGIKSGGIQF